MQGSLKIFVSSDKISNQLTSEVDRTSMCEGNQYIFYTTNRLYDMKEPFLLTKSINKYSKNKAKMK